MLWLFDHYQYQMLEHFQAISSYEHEVNLFVDIQLYIISQQFYLMVLQHTRESFLETDLLDSQNDKFAFALDVDRDGLINFVLVFGE